MGRERYSKRNQSVPLFAIYPIGVMRTSTRHYCASYHAKCSIINVMDINKNFRLWSFLRRFIKGTNERRERILLDQFGIGHGLCPCQADHRVLE